MIGRILPLLNNVVPVGIAMKGLEKVDPRFKKFFAGATAAGYGLNEAMEFLRNKFTSGSVNDINQTARPDEQANQRTIEQSQRAPNMARSAATLGGAALGGVAGAGLALGANAAFPEQDNPNMEQNSLNFGNLEQQSQELENNYSKQNNGNDQMGSINDPFMQLANYDVNLAQFFKDQLLENQRSPQEAAAIAKTSGSFGNLIKNIEKKTKMNFIDFVSNLFGSTGMEQKRRPMTREEAFGNFRDKLIQQETQQQSRMQQNQSGSNWNQVAQQLQNILKM